MQQEEQGADGEQDRIGAVHDGRAEQHAHGVEVVGEAGHDVAGAIALIEAGILLFQVAEQVVAKVELDFAGDADENPSLRVEEHAFDQADCDQSADQEQQLAVGDAHTQPVDGFLEDLGEEDIDAVGAHNAQAAPHVTPFVSAHVGEEGAQIAKHDPIVRGAWNGGITHRVVCDV